MYKRTATRCTTCVRACVAEVSDELEAQHLSDSPFDEELYARASAACEAAQKLYDKCMTVHAAATAKEWGCQLVMALRVSIYVLWCVF